MAEAPAAGCLAAAASFAAAACFAVAAFLSGRGLPRGLGLPSGRRRLLSGRAVVAAATGAARGIGRPARPPGPQEQRVGRAEADGDGAGQDEGATPAPGVDEPAGEQRGGGDPQVAEHAVDRERDAGLLPSVHDHRETDRMVDRGEHPDREQPQRDLDGGARQRRGDRARPDADEEDHHHPFPAPLVRDPSGRDGADPERDEPRRGVGDERRVAHAPLLGEPQRRHRREDQHEEVVEEMPDVEEQEVQAIARHLGRRAPDPVCGTIECAAPVPAGERPTRPVPAREACRPSSCAIFPATWQIPPSINGPEWLRKGRTAPESMQSSSRGSR